MNTSWFPVEYAWIFGALIGLLGAVVGTSVGVFAPRGKAKAFVYGIYWLSVSFSVICLILGAMAYFSGQPFFIWYGLGLAGLIGTLVFGSNYITLKMAYRQAEMRKVAAQNL